MVLPSLAAGAFKSLFDISRNGNKISLTMSSITWAMGCGSSGRFNTRLYLTYDYSNALYSFTITHTSLRDSIYN